ncbi:MAG: polyprenyl synthetase family protein [Nanoarchaeota archaeon]|nr:polyprenyl synthetase family protein [Nanoarchaeota archaeon]
MDASVTTIPEIALYIERGLEQIRTDYESAINKTLDDEVRKRIHMQYLLGGKNIRERGLLLAYGMTSNYREPPEYLLKAGAATALAHTATLCHDDVQDEADERRGVTTLAASIGPAAAIAVGDQLIAKAYELVTDLRSPFPRRQLSGALKYLAQGQRDEQLLQHDIKKGVYNFSLEQPLTKEQLDYLATRQSHIAYHKTGSLIEAVFAIGAHYGRDSKLFQNDPDYKTAFLLYRGSVQVIGLDAGYCYQLADDILDVTGDPTITGKPVATDLRNGVLNRVYVEVLKSTAPLPEKIRLFNILNGTITDEPSIQATITTAIDYGTPRVERYLHERKEKLSRAISKLDIADVSKQYLELMIEKLVERKA